MALNELWQGSFAETVFSSHIGEPETATLINKSINTVWKVKTGTETYVVKEIRDMTVDVESEYVLLKRFEGNSLFRPMFLCVKDETTSSFVAVHPYIEGVTLDKVLLSGSYNEHQAKIWGKQLEEYFTALREVSYDGFGKISQQSKPDSKIWMDFIYDYLERQRKKGPLMAQKRFHILCSAFRRYEGQINQEIITPMVVCGDVNTRNYIISEKANLVCIHTPMLWNADPAVPYGDAMVHLDQTPILDELLYHLEFPQYRLHLYAALSAYTILVFMERYSNIPLEDAKPWGRIRPLLEIFDEHISKV